MNPKAWVLVAAAVMGSASLVLADVWNATWEGRPDGAQLASDLDLFIQEFKVELRQREEAEHIFGPGADDNGLHQPGSARAFIQNAAPTDLNANVVGLEQWNSAAEADAGNDLLTDEIGVAVRDIGAGRLWVDLDGLSTLTTLDDRQLNVWDETTNLFVPVRAEATGALQLGNNLIYNGSFEITDGTGALASTAVPSGWVLAAPNPTITYQDPTGVSEGEGLAVNLTGTGADGAITQTLTSLKASTAYVVRARANPTTAADTCDLQVTGGAATVTDASAVGTAVYETLEVVATTTAGPAALVVRLEPNAATDVCRFDHVTAFEQSAVVSQPGIQSCRVTEGTVSANYYNDAGWTTVGTTCTITVPNPGMVIVTRGTVLADEDNGVADGSFVVRMQENINGGGAATVALGAENVRIGGVMSVDVNFGRANPAVGSTFVYTLDGQTDVGGGLDRNWDGAEAQGETPLSMLEVILLPTR